MKTYQFEAEIKKHPKINAAFIEFPYSVKEEFGSNGQVKVQVTFDGHEYRGSLVKMGQACHWIGLTQAIRNAIGKNPGDTVQVVLKKDESPRTVEIPEDMLIRFEKNKAAKAFFDTLSHTHKKEYVSWIVSAKKIETRERRLSKTMEMLAQNIRHP